ncbi:paired amphipathic helix protein SIN3, partial [Trifolium pratense]
DNGVDDAGQKRLSKNDASDFLNAVEIAFQDKSEKYSEFLMVILDYGAKR